MSAVAASVANPLRRRRFIGITAAACGLPLLPLGAHAAVPRLRVWTGVALGADAMLQIHHPDSAYRRPADRRVTGGGTTAGGNHEPLSAGVGIGKAQPRWRAGRSAA